MTTVRSGAGERPPKQLRRHPSPHPVPAWMFRGLGFRGFGLGRFRRFSQPDPLLCGSTPSTSCRAFAVRQSGLWYSTLAAHQPPPPPSAPDFRQQRKRQISMGLGVRSSCRPRKLKSPSRGFRTEVSLRQENSRVCFATEACAHRIVFPGVDYPR